MDFPVAVISVGTDFKLLCVYTYNSAPFCQFDFVAVTEEIILIKQIIYRYWWNMDLLELVLLWHLLIELLYRGKSAFLGSYGASVGLSGSLLGTSLESESSEVMLGEGRKERSSRPWILFASCERFLFLLLFLLNINLCMFLSFHLYIYICIWENLPGYVELTVWTT